MLATIQGQSKLLVFDYGATAKINTMTFLNSFGQKYVHTGQYFPMSHNKELY